MTKILLHIGRLWGRIIRAQNNVEKLAGQNVRPKVKFFGHFKIWSDIYWFDSGSSTRVKFTLYDVTLPVHVHCMTLHYLYVVVVWRYYVTRRHTTLQDVTSVFKYVLSTYLPTLRCKTLHYMYVAKRYTTLQDVTLHCKTLHYVVRRYTTL